MSLYKKLRKIGGIILRVHWFPTLYINFRLFPIPTAIKLPFVVRSRVKFRKLDGRVQFNCPVRFGLVIIGKDVDNMPVSFAPTQIFIQGSLIINGPVIINKGANLVVWKNGIMELGEYVLICSGVTLKAVKHVTVGKYAMISSGCFIMDSNIHCIRNSKTGHIANPNSPIEIGDYCWLSMYAQVLGGAKIPTNSVLTRYCFVNKDIRSLGGGIFGGMPAKLLKPDRQRVISFDIENKVHKFFMDYPDAEYYESFIGPEIITDDSVVRFFKV